MMGSTFEDDEATFGFPAGFPARSLEAAAWIHAAHPGWIDVGIEPLAWPALPGQAHRLTNQRTGESRALVAKHGAADPTLAIPTVEHPSPSKDRIAFLRQENQFLTRPNKQRQSRFWRASTGAIVAQVERKPQRVAVLGSAP